MLLGSIKNVNSNLPPDWIIQIFYSKDNYLMLINDTEVAELVNKGRVILDPRFFVTDWKFGDAPTYNKFITKPESWDYFLGEVLLYEILLIY